VVAVKLLNSEVAAVTAAASYLRGIAAAWPAGPYKGWAEALENVACAHVVDSMDDRADLVFCDSDGFQETWRCECPGCGRELYYSRGRTNQIGDLWFGGEPGTVFDDPECPTCGFDLEPIARRLETRISMQKWSAPEPDSRHWRHHAHGLTEV